jgi:hypothetical protein
MDGDWYACFGAGEILLWSTKTVADKFDKQNYKDWVLR